MKIIVRNQDDLTRFITLIKDRAIKPGKKYVAEFRQLSEKRTLDQNALFHLWCNVIEQETGQPADDVKEYIKQKFMLAVTKEIFDLDVPVWRTRDLNTVEFGVLLDNFKGWALDTLGIPLLTLEDKNFMEFYETYK
uniref:NinB protein n=1 Tax=viral metagenome TaxID=1070528 RepID=A0A6M3JL52_9ZZZZ